MNARIMMHGFVENMLKAKHQKTAESGEQVISIAEHLKGKYTKLITNTPHGSDDFAKELTKTMGNFFDADSLAAKNYSPEEIRRTKQVGNEAINLLADSAKYLRETEGKFLFDAHGGYTLAENIESVANVATMSRPGGSLVPADLSSNKSVNAAHNAKAYVREASEVAKEIYKRNGKTLAIAVGGLAATAMMLGSEQPNYGAAALPAATSNKAPILPPMNSQVAYASGKIGQNTGSNITARVSPRNDGGSRPGIQGALFGDGRTTSRVVYNKEKK
jgi:hypothetical protein